MQQAPIFHIHFLDAAARKIHAQDPRFNILKGGDPMSNGLVTPFAIAKVSISTEGRVARREWSDTSRDLPA